MTSAGACDRRARPAAPSCPDQDKRRDAPSSSVSSQSEAVVRIERGLARNRRKISVQRLSADRIVVRLIFEQCEFRRRLGLLRDNGFMLGQGGLATDSAVLRVVIAERARNRRGRGRRG